MSDREVARHLERIQAIIADGALAHDVESYISDSWRRCVAEHRLNPSDCREPEVLESALLRERRQRHERLLSLASDEMGSLYQQVAGSGHVVILTDADGCVLDYVGDMALERQTGSAGLLPGALWNERVQGTNGMGTCLMTGKPVTVHHDEHFLVRNTVLTCSAAPIYDPEGDLMAVLDVSSTASVAQQHALSLVGMSAQLIENRVFHCAYRDQYLLHFHSRPEFLNTLGEGVLSFDPAGRVLGATRSALFQLGVDARVTLVGQDIAEVFDMRLADLIDEAARLHHGQPIPLRGVVDGRRFFASLKCPARSGSHTGHNVRAAKIRDAGASELDLEQLNFGDPRMAQAIRQAKKLIDRDVSLLLSGPTGVGKGLFAKALHGYSDRADKPFVTVNCAAIPETLIESELFGYKAGAFTGANRQGSRGKIVLANGGTLFLDEIGDMPLPLQARLLRVLEEREVVPLGADTAIRVDLNIISATHRDLKTLVQCGEFREDLYYRLRGQALILPPLRQRTDKRQLIEYILKLEQAEDRVRLEPEAMHLLLAYAWPGNIRELRNTLRTLIALCEDERISAADLADEFHQETGADDPQCADTGVSEAQNPLASAERAVLLRELESMRWNVAKVARNFRVSRNTLYRKMRRYGIKPPR
ncbi:sigma-54-dependent Fis family transcriptional regulator [Acidihalobacter ferrooxydans]|uniref:Sigma-54-dependent Fis family transcriptional regulator n=1 Tax=Acidihalobacter ferrooxydans TaxID=1765967 RepID=A0A1P8UH46_9GAMM|nr:sigma-54-dependent Fis family transcriptional regulator [Acidihalobacter ferrooxydans]APZ43094.1 sigma-54-dependent Fis family transcriptional regulator [Acidihalobacter ferrooxydans]